MDIKFNNQLYLKEEENIQKQVLSNLEYLLSK